MLQFVSETYLKTITPLAGNIDIDELKPFIIETQNNRVRELLGKKFYDYLMTKTQATLSADETALCEFIKPFLAWYIVYDALPGIHFKIKPKGVLGGVGETVERGTRGDVQWLMEIYQNKAEGYGQQLQDYLWVNRNLFPDYIHPDNYHRPYKGTTYQADIAFDEPYGCGSRINRNIYPYNE